MDNWIKTGEVIEHRPSNAQFTLLDAVAKSIPSETVTIFISWDGEGDARHYINHTWVKTAS